MERWRRGRGAEGRGGRLKEGFFINQNRSPRAVPTLSSPRSSRAPLETAPCPSAEQPHRGSGRLFGGSGHFAPSSRRNVPLFKRLQRGERNERGLRLLLGWAGEHEHSNRRCCL